jgi:hypothetical protein
MATGFEGQPDFRTMTLWWSIDDNQFGAEGFQSLLKRAKNMDIGKPRPDFIGGTFYGSRPMERRMGMEEGSMENAAGHTVAGYQSVDFLHVAEGRHKFDF